MKLHTVIIYVQTGKSYYHSMALSIKCVYVVPRGPKTPSRCLQTLGKRPTLSATFNHNGACSKQHTRTYVRTYVHRYTMRPQCTQLNQGSKIANSVYSAALTSECLQCHSASYISLPNVLCKQFHALVPPTVLFHLSELQCCW